MDAGNRLWHFLAGSLHPSERSIPSLINHQLIRMRSPLWNLLLMKTCTRRLPALELEMKKIFYGTFLSGIATTMTIFVLVLTSDFLARHALIQLFLTLAAFILTSCAVWTGIKVIFKSDVGKKANDILLLFFSSVHVLFVGFILLLLIF